MRQKVKKTYKSKQVLTNSANNSQSCELGGADTPLRCM